MVASILAGKVARPFVAKGRRWTAVLAHPDARLAQSSACATRRHTLSGLLLTVTTPFLSGDAQARGLDAYVKKKKLDPLASYVPALLVAQTQLLDVPLAAKEFGVAAGRKLIRSGAFEGVRDNVRAIGEYAEQRIGADAAKARMSAFFNSINALDQALFLAIRGDATVPDNLQALVDACNEALEGVLGMVPDDDLATGREVVAVLQSLVPVSDNELTEEQREEVRRLAGLL